MCGLNRQPHRVRDRHQVIGGDRRQFGEAHHAQTLRLHLPVARPAQQLRRIVNVAGIHG